MTTYAIKYGNGRVDGGYETLEAALEAVRAEYPVVGHDGDLTRGGDRTLFWASPEDSQDDDGARAAGSIVPEVRYRPGRPWCPCCNDGKTDETGGCVCVEDCPNS